MPKSSSSEMTYCYRYLKKETIITNEENACVSSEGDISQGNKVLTFNENHSIHFLKSEQYIQDNSNTYHVTSQIIKLCHILLKEMFTKKRLVTNHISVDSEIDYSSSIRYNSEREYQLNLYQTISNSVKKNGNLIPVELDVADFYVYDKKFKRNSLIILLLDMSLSMKEEGKFKMAKELAMSLAYLQTRKKIKNIKIETVGFFNNAKHFTFDELKRAGIQHSQPFTNLKEGLRLSRHLVKKSRVDEKCIVIISDGSPTAIYDNGMLQVDIGQNNNKIKSKIITGTANELRKITRQGVNVNFMIFRNSEKNNAFLKEINPIINGNIYILENTGVLVNKFIDQFSGF